MCLVIEFSCFSVVLFIGCVWEVVVGLFFFGVVVFWLCCRWLWVVSIWLVVGGKFCGDCGGGVVGVIG